MQIRFEVSNYRDGLRITRQVQQISLRTLAEKIGCDASYLSRCEKNKRHPSLDFLQRWSDGLGYTLNMELKEVIT